MTPILNSEFKLPADGWHQLAPLGEYPNTTDDGRAVVQVVDKRACELMANRFAQEAAKPGFSGLLVDFDHGSLNKYRSSRAAAWIAGVQVRPDGLYVQNRWTGSGKAAVEGGDFRFLSPVFPENACENLGGGRLRPMALAGAAVTNDPNMKGMAPLTNRGHDAAEDKEQKMHEKLTKLLGLTADAADDAIEAKAGMLVNRAKEADALQARVTELEQQQLAAQVETDLAEFAPVIANRDEVKAQLLANREGTLKVLRGLKKPETKPETKPEGMLPNRRDGKAPAGDPGSGADSAAGTQKAAAIRNRAAEIRQTERVSYVQAFARAEEELK